MWNLHASLKPVSGEEVFLSKKGKLTMNNKEIELTNVAVLHYEDEEGSWMGNVGDFLSIKYFANLFIPNVN